MGTVPVNYPPDAVIAIGQTLVGNALNLTGTLATATFLTAPNPGLYLVSAAMRIVSTNGAGSLTTTVTTPHAGTITEPTQDGMSKIVAILKDLAPGGGGTDGFMAAVPLWMNAGDTLQIGCVASGLTGTTYNVWASMTRLA